MGTKLGLVDFSSVLCSCGLSLASLVARVVVLLCKLCVGRNI